MTCNHNNTSVIPMKDNTSILRCNDCSIIIASWKGDARFEA